MKFNPRILRNKFLTLDFFRIHMDEFEKYANTIKKKYTYKT